VSCWPASSRRRSGAPYDPDTAVWVADGAPEQARDLAMLVRAQVGTAGPDGPARRGGAVAALARAVDAAFALGCARAVGADAVAKVVAAGGTISVDVAGPTPRLQVLLPRGVAWRHGRALALALLAHVEAATPARERWVVSLDEPRDVANAAVADLLRGPRRRGDGGARPGAARADRRRRVSGMARAGPGAKGAISRGIPGAWSIPTCVVGASTQCVRHQNGGNAGWVDGSSRTRRSRSVRR
jgi:prepilin-type processing-associated H-X9-DG protein